MQGVNVQLDNIIIALRQRTPWEAMDLGVMVMRKLWPVIFIPWLILISIVLAFVIFATVQGYGYFAALFLWVIKPVYESMILFILSRGVFGEYLSTAEVFSNKKQWLKTGLLTTVLFWRLSPSRSFNMPVHLLEGLTGEKRKKRLDLLHRVSGSHSAGLTIIGIHFEYVIGMTLYVLIFFIAPETTADSLALIIDDSSEQMLWVILGNIIYAITLFILEPFYVASGFMLYLNRRTQLEAWDVELDFKKLANKLEIQRKLSGDKISTQNGSNSEFDNVE